MSGSFEGYDHAFVLDKNLDPAAVVHSPSSGLTLTMTTTEVAVQFYTGIFLDGTLKAKASTQSASAMYERYSGFCLEAQGYPDAPNKYDDERRGCSVLTLILCRAHFPSTVLRPGQIYSQRTIYTISRKL